MKTCWILLVFICLVLCSVSERVSDNGDGTVDIGGVKVEGTHRDHYGILMVEVNKDWTPVCDYNFRQSVALVACRQMNFVDGRFIPGAIIDTISMVSPIHFKCNGTERQLDDCSIVELHNCSSQTYVTLYCAQEIIKTEATFDVRIHGTVGETKPDYGALEIKKYGFWGPVCSRNWSNMEANTACRHLGYRGGVAQYTTISDPAPLVLGQFKCRIRDTSLENCEYREFGQNIGCQHDVDDYNEQQVAGVICFNDDEGLQFRLSNQWYGEVQVLYNGTWGSVCNTDWDANDSKTICNQLGYRDGRPSYEVDTSTGRAYMDNVYCTGTEESILLCDYIPGWKSTGKECSSAYVTCDKTICGSVDVRNEAHLSQLKYCNIVEGNLTIAFIDTVTWDDFSYYSCPGLVEITDYLLLFRVYGLRSLELLFPNLAIIRGDMLFTDYYALFVFEMPDLADLSLKNLVTISRGSVRLEKNPNLCYIETIDWDIIVKDSADNYFKNNRDIHECWNQCPSMCGKTLFVDKYVPRCWNVETCQKRPSCSANCDTGMCNGEICCDKNCVAGCTGITARQCTACRHVSYQDSSEISSCIDQCPSGTYMFRNRRCLQDYECTDMVNRSRNYQATNEVYEDLKLVTLPNDNHQLQGLCVTECPLGFQIDPNDHYLCAPCQGKCPKVYPDNVQIDSILAAEVMKGYNIIDGYLEIKLMHGDKISTILEENLADLEEVTGYVKIQYSYALLTLHFLKNLRKIGGKTSYNGYVLFVFNNVNLQELFLDDVTQRLSLGPGKVFFHSNRKLCYNKISQFLTTVGRDLKTISREDVSTETNGDLIPCEIQKLSLTLKRKKSNMVYVIWSLMTNIVDVRRLLGYMLYWKETIDESLSTFEGRDACSEDLWESKTACTRGECSGFGKELVTGLKPWTKYAMYVKALTVSSSHQGAISDVTYFKTDADAPSSPLNLQIQTEQQGELHVTWDAPSTLNGDDDTVYLVEWKHKKIDSDLIETRDYCLNPITSNLLTKNEEVKVEEKENITVDDNCCCPKTGQDLVIEERERKLAIDFHDFLQNSLYQKSFAIPVRTSKDDLAALKTFNISSYKSRLAGNVSANSTETDKFLEKETSKDSEKEVSIGHSSSNSLALEKSWHNIDLVNKREWKINDLGYFTHLNVEVKACNKDSNNASILLCSAQAIIFGRTLPDENADAINSSLIQWRLATNKTGSVFIKWQEPLHPNGLVLAYDIQVQNPNIVTKPICITAKMYRRRGKHGIELEKLSPGNYTLKIRAISLAGNGSWSDEIFFHIPYQPRIDGNINVLVVILICVAVTVILVMTLVIWCFFKRRKTREEMMFSTNPDYVQSYEVYTPDEWEIDRDKVFIVKELGHGSFGMVYEGYFWDDLDKKTEGRKIPVAIKTTNKNSTVHDKYEFLQEASIMKKFCCHHVVKLIGVVSKEQPAYVLMELMPNGDLKSFLRLHRPDHEDNCGRQPPTLRQFLQMAAEIADGMAYLADNKFVHRDLAARNCMVGEELVVKIGDFGMTRDIYETDYYRKGSRGLLPVRWMPPEALHDGVFTSMTDVWSYGVVLWEMATLAEQPYQGLSNEEVMTYVLSGRIMDSPEGCPVRLYDLMVKCWRFRPKQRPTFKEIIELLLPDLNEKFEEVSYFFSEENARNMEACDGKIYENQFPDGNNSGSGEDSDDGYSDSPMNDYMEEALPMLCDNRVGGQVSSGVVSRANGLNEQHGQIHENHDPKISYSQAHCDINTDDSVHSMLNSALNNKVKFPFNKSDEKHFPGDVDNTDKFHPSLKETSLVNGHIQPDVRTTVC